MSSDSALLSGGTLTPGYALEITGTGIRQLADAAPLLPQGARVNIAFLGNETHEQRIAAGRALREHGLAPVPIISARRLRSAADRDALLDAHAAASSPERYLFVGGDPDVPAGPYADATALLRSGVLERHGVRRAGVVGYPDGHPKMDADTHWRTLRGKVSLLRDAGCEVEITTQYGLDPATPVRWIERLREAGIDAPVRIGVPGPARARTLLRYAERFGVVHSAAVLHRAGLGPDALAADAWVSADAFWQDLHEALDAQDLGRTGYHLYPFGGIARGAEWMRERIAADQPS